MFGFDLEFLLAGFANPVVFAVDKGVVMDAQAVVFGAQIAFHDRKTILLQFGFKFLRGGTEHDEIDAAVGGAAFGGVV